MRGREGDAVAAADRGLDIPLSNDLFPNAISSPAGWLDEEEEDDVSEIPAEDEEINICEICRSMWWNNEGKWVKYGESDIGESVKSFVSDNFLDQLHQLFHPYTDIYELLNLPFGSSDITKNQMFVTRTLIFHTNVLQYFFSSFKFVTYGNSNKHVLLTDMEQACN